MKRHGLSSFGDFQCIHCRQHVSANALISGVQNRNHCPYCLHSRHLDLREAGDRLSPCKGRMRPVGLAVKQARKKYGSRQGELMLVHLCVECGKLSINRIAADDFPETVYEIFTRSLKLDTGFRLAAEDSGVTLLRQADAELVRARLYGWGNTRLPTLQPSEWDLAAWG